MEFESSIASHRATPVFVCFTIKKENKAIESFCIYRYTNKVIITIIIIIIIIIIIASISPGQLSIKLSLVKMKIWRGGAVKQVSTLRKVDMIARL